MFVCNVPLDKRVEDARHGLSVVFGVRLGAELSFGAVVVRFLGGMVLGAKAPKVVGSSSSSSSSSNSSSSAGESLEVGTGYKQGGIFAKAKGWRGRSSHGLEDVGCFGGPIARHVRFQSVVWIGRFAAFGSLRRKFVSSKFGMVVEGGDRKQEVCTAA